VGFLFIAFWGAYKRRTCLLAVYFWVNVICFVLSIVAVLVLIMVVPAAVDNSASTDASGSMSIDNSGVHHIQKFVSHIISLPSVLNPKNATLSNTNTTTIVNNGNSTIIHPNHGTHGYPIPSADSVEAETGVSVGAIVIISFVAVVLAVLILFFKVYSVILAWKMRKILIANRRCSSNPVSSPVCEDSKPLINPGYPATSSVNGDVSMSVFPEQTQQQQQPQQMPMYMPYPYAFNPMMQGMQGMQGQGQFPMVFNQNGQPVFYSYQPMPQQTQL
jgi:hypothetical protein